MMSYVLYKDRIGRILRQASDRRVLVLFEDGNSFWLPLRDLQRVDSDKKIQLREEPIKILISRMAAYGDVLLIEPIIRALKRKYPNSEINVWTQCTDILRYCPLIKNLSTENIEHTDIFIDLNGSSEFSPQQNIIDAYAKTAGVTLIDSERIPIYNSDIKWIPQKKRIVVCTDKNWPSKNWDSNRWINVLKKLKEDGYQIIEVGANSYLGIGEDFVGKLSVYHTAEFIASAEIFLCEDSLLLRIAQSIGTPILAIMGCTSPKYIIHDWSKAKVLWTDKSKLDCAGCRHWRPVPLYKVDCLKDKVYCLEYITEEMFLDKFYNSKFGEDTFVYT
jgi:ADP-heptose:LPS heptosyltransferase